MATIRGHCNSNPNQPGLELTLTELCIDIKSYWMKDSIFLTLGILILINLMSWFGYGKYLFVKHLEAFLIVKVQCNFRNSSDRLNS